MTKNTAEKQRVRGRPFPPGVSGNPRGRPKGAQNKRALIAGALLRSDTENLGRASTAVNGAIVRYFDRREQLSPGDLKLAMALLVGCGDIVCAYAELVGQLRFQASRASDHGTNGPSALE
ncbi:DUF5681 domain-containing protein [Methylocystis sp. MJC1]|uniref:DUF5681 domain-containing protein n=1 Tax=Methylocystis sp. MJC1 TaxID=2654282 RepID=UPI001FEDA2A4|nr:DUF5681 domain-containing protein [Methylocystis sp. MJC1]